MIGGHSWGASLALQAALGVPETADGLVYVSGVGAGQEWHAVTLRAEARRRRTAAEHGPAGRAEEPRPQRRTRRSSSAALAWAPDFADRAPGPVLATAEARASMASPINVEANATINAEIATWDEGRLLERCRHLEVPALVLHGAEDPRPAWAVEPLPTPSPSRAGASFPVPATSPGVEAPDATTAAVAVCRLSERSTAKPRPPSLTRAGQRRR